MLAAADRIVILPDQTPTETLHHLSDKLTEAFDLNLSLLMHVDSPEPVHKARVALRRFRAMLDAFAPILDDDLADALHDRARALFRVLGAIRDADVMAARFEGTKTADKTMANADQQRQKGRKALRRKKADGFRPWVLRRLRGKSWRQTGKKAKALRDAPVTGLAALALDRAWAEALSNGTDLLLMSVRAQHDLRKDLKRLRYLSEFFADLWPEAGPDVGPDVGSYHFLADLRDMQDDLGEVSDSATARALGHHDTADTASQQTRAAAAWTRLVAQGPWWQA